MIEHTSASIHSVNGSYCPYLDAQNICIKRDYEWNMYLDKPLDLHAPYPWGNLFNFVFSSLPLES